MLNFVWLALIVVAVLLGSMTGQMQAVGDQAVTGAEAAIKLAGDLLAIMTLWLGLMRLADRAGLVHRLGLALKPVMIWLFPDVPPDHPAMGSIIMNMAANILGLNNAATPLGLRAMDELEQLNPRPGVASNAMCMLLAINTSSITLIPVTVIGILALNHGTNPTIIIGTSLAATAVAHAFAIATVKILERTPFYRLPRVPAGGASTARAADRRSTTTEGAKVATDAARHDVERPWVPGSRWILALLAGVFLGLLAGFAYPGLVTHLSHAVGLHAVAPPAASPPIGHEGRAHFLFIRPLASLSLLTLPWLILFFPVYAALRRIPVYEEFVEGAKESVQIIIRILPFIVGMLVAMTMFRTAGGEQLLERVLGPITNPIGFPALLVPLAVLRPFSGTGALAIFTALVLQYGANSPLVLTAGTMYGCSETTFYVIAVYFGSVGIRKTRHAIPAGLVADIVGPIASVMICRAVFGPL
jgi:spore maturation protein SpmA